MGIAQQSRGVDTRLPAPQLVRSDDTASALVLQACRCGSVRPRLRGQGISADIRSGCVQAARPRRHTVFTSAGPSRRTLTRYVISKTGCLRPTGCRGAACAGFWHRRAPAPSWHNRMARLWALPWCCFAQPVQSRGFILSPSPPGTPAAASRRPSSRPPRKRRGRADACGCGLKSTKIITAPLRSIARPGMNSSVGIVIITKIAVMRSGSRSDSQGDGGPTDIWHGCEIRFAPAHRSGILHNEPSGYPSRTAKATRARKGFPS